MPINKAVKDKILKGSISLALKQFVSAGLSLVSVLVVARILGPAQYGVVAIALGIFYFTAWTSKFGLPAYLIRVQAPQQEILLIQNSDEDRGINSDRAVDNLDLSQRTFLDEVFKQILSFFNIVGIIYFLLFWLAAPLFGQWTGRSEIVDIVRWLPLPLWLDMAAGISVSRLERDLNFAQIGMIETIAQASNYAITIPLVLSGWGYWGPIAGLTIQSATLFISARWLRPIPLRLRLQRKYLQPALAYGLTLSSADWVSHLRLIAVPLLITRFVGIEATGIVNIAIRLVEQVTILRLVLRRMSFSILSKFSGDAVFIRKAISRGMAYQSLIVGATCAVFACASALIITTLFGEEWLLSSQIFPFIALSVLIKSAFDLHNSALYSIGKNLAVTWRDMVHTSILILGCIILLPTYGIWGYCVSEVLALSSYFLVHKAIVKYFGKLDYKAASYFIAAALISLIASSLLSIYFSLPIVILSYGVLFVLPATRSLLEEVWLILISRQKKLA